MLRVLIAISSCFNFEKNGNNQALRDTWLPFNFIGLDYKFFFGVGQGGESSVLPPDSILLPEVNDGYGDLSKKTQHSLRWAADRDYDFVFRCFPDTYCRPERLMYCGFQAYDYYGDFRQEHCGPDNYPSGGCGYMMSRKAYTPCLNAPIAGVHKVSEYAEDLWVGQILNRHRDIGLKYFDDSRFVNRGTRGPGPLKTNAIISTHLSCPDYDKGHNWGVRVREKHQQWLASQ